MPDCTNVVSGLSSQAQQGCCVVEVLVLSLQTLGIQLLVQPCTSRVHEQTHGTPY